ncbi:MAG: pitrilysin family protein, partial [Pseudomonadota bacterium]
FTFYYQTMAKRHLPELMRYEADRMRNLLLREDEIATELKVVLEERATRLENDPQAKIRARAYNALFRAHPYRIPIIGWRSETAHLTRAHLQDFYDRYYQPNNAIVVVTGDLDVAAVVQMAREIYGKIPRGPSVARRMIKEPPAEGIVRVELRDALVAQNQWHRLYMIPNLHDQPMEDAAALVVLAELLNAAGEKGLYAQMVEQRAVALGTGAYFHPMARGPVIFGIWGVSTDGTDDTGDSEQLQEAVMAYVASLADDFWDPQAIATIKARIRDEQILLHDSLTQRAHHYAHPLVSGYSLDDQTRFHAALQNVTRDAIMAALQRILASTSWVDSHLLREAS